MRTYLYKMISDRGGAPCAPEPEIGERRLLSLALCKPALRRTAQPGDRIVAVTSRSLQQREGYPEAAVIYAATVAQAVEARLYYAPGSRFRSRPDCVYGFAPGTGVFRHTGLTALHATAESQTRDLGKYPYYRNGRVLLCETFRYFGREAVPIPEEMPRLREVAQALGQGHRVFTSGADAGIDREWETLFRRLMRKRTRFTPRDVQADVYETKAFQAKSARDAEQGEVRETARSPRRVILETLMAKR